MATVEAKDRGEATDRGVGQSTPNTHLRVAQIALVFNAALASVAGVGYATGFLPHAAEQPTLARRVAAGELAGAFLFVLVAIRLGRSSFLILPALGFVFCQLGASLYEVLTRADPNDLPPLFVEGLFFSIYLVYAVTEIRTRRRTSERKGTT